MAFTFILFQYIEIKNLQLFWSYTSYFKKVIKKLNLCYEDFKKVIVI